MKKQYNAMTRAQSAYTEAVDEMQCSIVDVVGFEFSINYQEADGFCLLNVETANTAGLSSCLSHIKKHGTLTSDDHLIYTI